MGKGYKGKNPRGGAKGKTADEEAEAEFMQRRGGGQSSNVGMLPPSDSDEEGEEAGAAPRPAAAPKGQSATAGLMPPSDSEDDDKSSAGEPDYLKEPAKKKEPPTQERDPELLQKDMERLEIIRKKREEDRQKRIDKEGWDRFAPVTETNKAPGHYVPPAKHDSDDD